MENAYYVETRDEPDEGMSQKVFHTTISIGILMQHFSLIPVALVVACPD